MADSKGKTSNIKVLLDAEAKAGELLKEAKKRRFARLKTAEDDVKSEVEAFKVQREEQFQEYKKSRLQTEAGDIINSKKEAIIQSIKEQTTTTRGEAVEMLVNKVFAV